MENDSELGGNLLAQGRQIIRRAKREAWDDGYEACKRGEQPHNPYRPMTEEKK